MAGRGEAAVARARALIGVRFRPQGRSRETGLDCIGLVAAAADIAGVPRDYALRGAAPERLAAGLAAAGLVPVAQARPGDVLVMAAGPEQLHLGMLTKDGLIHADAALRRVVERPGDVPWPILAAWRWMED